MTQQPYAHPLALISVAAPEDTALLTQWETHLHPLRLAGWISVWSELHLAPGADRLQEQQQHLDHANVVVLLLSASFFDSPGCLAMMDTALERSHTSKLRVIPLLLRSVVWQESPLGTLPPWPSNGKPITLWSDQDEGWHDCVQELRRLLGRRISEKLPSNPPAKHADTDWRRMLRRLRRSYKDLLDQSLHGIARMELGLSTRPDMVSNITNLLFQLPQGGERLLAPGTSILSAYDESEEELLILGASGAGKSTLLLDLAQQLVERALSDPAHPLPVILRLSSWAIRRPPLAEWMIEQLRQTYDVPRTLSERWVRQGRLLPLLDGLDEMEEYARPACIAAINHYHRTQLTPLVICSRQAEYEVAAQQERLALQSAIIVQPLSDEQIENYLRTTGPSFAEVRAALHQQPALWELATTPLMLSVLLLTYRGIPASEIITRKTGLERQVWADYIVRMVAEKGNIISYPLEITHSWLSWLAQQMHAHQQTIFYAEYLHTDWLEADQQRTATRLATYLPAMVLGFCVSILILLLTGGIYNLIELFQWGLLGGSVGGCLIQQLRTGAVVPGNRIFTSKETSLINSVLLGTLVAASCGLFLASPGDQLRDGCILGLGNGLSIWIFQVLVNLAPRQPSSVARTHPSRWRHLTTWLNTIAAPQVWRAAIVLGAGIGLSYGLRIGLSLGWPYGLEYALIQGLSSTMMVVFICVILTASTGPLRFAERIRWTWHSLHLRTNLLITGIIFLFFGLSNGLSFWLLIGLGGGLSNQLSSGLGWGLQIGLSCGLSYWMVVGLYHGMKQEHLEDQDRHQFNQGIRRSLRNGCIISLLSAIILILIIGLSIALGSGLNTGLNTDLSFGISEGIREGISYVQNSSWLLLLTGMVTMWMLSGGLTVLRHYTIRMLLDLDYSFPFHAQAFLDDATSRILLRRVGGGYSFIHRRLQDYFTDTAVPPLEERVQATKGQ